MPRLSITLTFYVLTALLLSSGVGSVSAQLPPPNWSVSKAAENLRDGVAQQRSSHLLALAARGDNSALLKAIDNLELDTSVSSPERDRSLYLLAVGLSDLPPWHVNQPVLNRLLSYEAGTLIPHDDHPQAGVPMFHVAAAMQGSINAWQRQEGRQQARELEGLSVAEWLAAYKSASSLARAGFRDVLSAESGRLTELSREALKHLEEDAEMALLAGRGAALSHDLDLAASVIQRADPSQLPVLLREIGAHWSATERQQLVRWTAENSDIPVFRLVDSVMKSASGKSGKGQAPAPQAENERLIEWVEDAPADDTDRIALGYPVPVAVDTPWPFHGFRSYAGLTERHQQLVADTHWVHPEIVGQTRNDRTIWAYRLGDADRLTAEGLPEHAMLTNGGIHAREWQSPEVTTGIIELLATAENHPMVDFLRANANMIVIPVMNIDGFLQTQRFPNLSWMGTDPNNPEFSPRDGRMRRKNMLGVDEIMSTQDDHLFGVDLNRNNPPYYASNPQRSSGTPASIVHHGAGAHSEPETQALVAAAQLGPALHLSMYTDVHSFSQVHFWVRNDNNRLALNTQSVLRTFSNHHVNFEAGKYYGFAGATQVARNRGIGSTDEFFTHTYQVPSWTLEVEPRNGAGLMGAEYGGYGRNGHDGFILPESEVPRVRTELAESFAVAYYRQSGPPSLTAMRIVDAATGAVVYQAEWDVISNTARALYRYQVQPLQLERDYIAWMAWDKPMRWRENGDVTVFANQGDFTLDVNLHLYAGEDRLTISPGDSNWLNQAGEAPTGFRRYSDDALAFEFKLPANANNNEKVLQLMESGVSVETWDITGLATDADPSTVAQWEAGGWARYEDADGNSDTDRGGPDRTLSVDISPEDLGDPFVIEAGTSAAWFDQQRNGEGYILEVLENDVAVMYWFTFDDAGEQDWYVALGEVRGNRMVFPELLRVSGGTFGPGFDPSQVTREVVGMASFTWKDCDSGEMSWELNAPQTGFRKGRSELSRLTTLMGLDCGLPRGAPISEQARLSGSWFDPSHNGEGYVLEVLAGGEALVYWFGFDPAGQRRWFFGLGEWQDRQWRFESLSTTSGALFGEEFRSEDVEVSEWGSLTLQLECGSGTADFTPLEAGFEPGTLELHRLTSLQEMPCEVR